MPERNYHREAQKDELVSVVTHQHTARVCMLRGDLILRAACIRDQLREFADLFMEWHMIHRHI